MTSPITQKRIVFLCVGVLLLLMLFGTVMYFENTSESEIVQDDISKVPVSLEGKSAFEIGQYYFNHDEDKTGPYDLAKAQYFYTQEIENNPKGNDIVWYQSGRIDFLNGNFDAALEKFEKQREYFGDSIPNVYYMIGLTYGYKARQTNNPEDWKKGEDAFKKSIEFFYQAPWPRVDLAWLYFAQGKYEEMKPVLEEGLTYEANNPWLLNMYGLALLNTGEKEMAKEYFIFALELSEKMSPTDWGESYPGNNPEFWIQGLAEFKATIQKNIELAK